MKLKRKQSIRVGSVGVGEGLAKPGTVREHRPPDPVTFYTLVNGDLAPIDGEKCFFSRFMWVCVYVFHVCVCVLFLLVEEEGSMVCVYVFS
ncbi:hypothetical protein Hanom_Chr01g00079271 [Helianthus anomalus]